ncbi:HECT-domain-containing protein [Piromyces finnis]|uniref:HECT-type E3 ubiquitin transferase n=1 Tax=Piromyces finnis TaxID=1754191 RepID=A0A1Y1VBT8_9FUNG|nr:HECT-domain-containing protein [Piromyces finnis]|eukprot:ORX50726.1 HECT-domain-containing protein [Piromyces finnis]
MNDNNSNIYNEQSEQVNNNISLNGHGSFISSFLSSSPFSSLKHHPSSSCTDLSKINKESKSHRLAMSTLNDSDSSEEDLSSEESIKNENLIDKEAYELNNRSSVDMNQNKIPNSHFTSYNEKSMSDIKKTGSTFCSNTQLLKLKRESSSNMMRTKSLQDLPSLSSATDNFSKFNFRSFMSPSPSFSSLQVLASDDTYGQEVEIDEYPDEPQFALSYLTLPLLKLAIATYIRTDKTNSSSLNLTAENDKDNTKLEETNETQVIENLNTMNINDNEKNDINDNQSCCSNESLSINMEKKISSMETKNDPSFIISTIKSVFSSNEALNKSFLLKPFKSSNENTSGLDIEAIEESYNLILNLKPKELFVRTLANAIEILLAKLTLNIKAYQNGTPENLRLLIILCKNPLLKDPQYHEQLLRKLCIVLSQLKNRSKNIMIKWFSEFKHNAFEELVGNIQQYIVSHFSVSPNSKDPIVAAIKVLQLLYIANELARPNQIVPIDRFYNDTISKRLNFKDEYKNWKKLIDTKKYDEFSYFKYPILFNPVSKTRILHIDAMVQMSQEFEDAFVNHALVIHAQHFLQDSSSISNLEDNLKDVTCPYLVLEVRRAHLVEDVLNQISKKEKDLKKPLKVKFVGGGEEGMDQGGVQKEFFQIITAQLLDQQYGMFTYDTETRYSWINGASLESEKHFELVGIVIGLALYNGVILAVNFPRLMYKRLLDEEPTLEDIKLAFPALGKGLEQMLNWTDGDVGDIFMRSFQISYEVYGQVKTYNLVENGENILVTNENREEFVKLYIHHLVIDSVSRQFRAFRRGFYKVCGGYALKMCRAEELELLISGSVELDYEELEKATEYDDGYSKDHIVIKNFWEIVHAMTYDQKKKLLMFVTASDRVPLKGLGNLTFVIQRNGPDTDRLPTALTCFGRLLLPEYSTKEKLKNRLLTAIENAKGFGLV